MKKDFKARKAWLELPALQGFRAFAGSMELTEIPATMARKALKGCKVLLDIPALLARLSILKSKGKMGTSAHQALEVCRASKDCQALLLL